MVAGVERPPPCTLSPGAWLPPGARRIFYRWTVELVDRDGLRALVDRSTLVDRSWADRDLLAEASGFKIVATALLAEDGSVGRYEDGWACTVVMAVEELLLEGGATLRILYILHKQSEQDLDGKRTIHDAHYEVYATWPPLETRETSTRHEKIRPVKLSDYLENIIDAFYTTMYYLFE